MYIIHFTELHTASKIIYLKVISMWTQITTSLTLAGL